MKQLSIGLRELPPTGGYGGPSAGSDY